MKAAKSHTCEAHIYLECGGLGFEVPWVLAKLGRVDLAQGLMVDSMFSLFYLELSRKKHSDGVKFPSSPPPFRARTETQMRNNGEDAGNGHLHLKVYLPVYLPIGRPINRPMDGTAKEIRWKQ